MKRRVAGGETFGGEKTTFDYWLIVAKMSGRANAVGNGGGRRAIQGKKRKDGDGSGASENERDSAFGERGDSV